MNYKAENTVTICNLWIPMNHRARMVMNYKAQKIMIHKAWENISYNAKNNYKP